MTNKGTICSAFVLNLSLQMLSLTHLSMFRPGKIMIFNSDLHHICPHLHSEANAELSYLSSGQMSYLSLSQIPTNATNIIFEPHFDCICLTSNVFSPSVGQVQPLTPGLKLNGRQNI